jgi:acetyl esterase/lipase
MNKIKLLVILSIFSVVRAQQHVEISKHTYPRKPGYTVNVLKGGAHIFLPKNRILSISAEQKEETPAKIPKRLYKNLHIETFQFENRSIYVLGPKNGTSKNSVLFLHGGAYLHNVFRQHWVFLEQFCLENQIKIIVPDYPLLPQHTFMDAIHFLHLLHDSGKIDLENLHFMGDSAGGGLALAFALHLKNDHKKLPESIILFAPWLDVSLTNPNIKKMAKKDPTLGVKPIQKIGALWCKNEFQNPLASPIYGNFSGLPPVFTFIGTHDILYPDCFDFHQKMLKASQSHRLFVYPKLFHDFMMLPGLKQSKDVRNHLQSILK